MRGFKTHRVPPGPRSPTPKAKLPDNSPKGSHGHHPPACHNLRRPFSAPAAPQCNRPERAGAGWNMGVWLKGGPLDTVSSRKRTRLFCDLGFFGVPHTKYVKPAPTAAVGSKFSFRVDHPPHRPRLFPNLAPRGRRGSRPRDMTKPGWLGV